LITIVSQNSGHVCTHVGDSNQEETCDCLLDLIKEKTQPLIIFGKSLSVAAIGQFIHFELEAFSLLLTRVSNRYFIFVKTELEAEVAPAFTGFTKALAIAAGSAAPLGASQ
jgi:hypothetical protein